MFCKHVLYLVDAFIPVGTYLRKNDLFFIIICARARIYFLMNLYFNVGLFLFCIDSMFSGYVSAFLSSSLPAEQRLSSGQEA